MIECVYVYCIANTSKGAKVQGDKQERKEKYTGTQDCGISIREVYLSRNEVVMTLRRCNLTIKHQCGLLGYLETS